MLVIDAAINLSLGLLLITFSPQVIQFLGVPVTEQLFYPTMLGAVLVGIGFALLIEHFRGPKGIVGLELGGAIVINLCGGLALAAWLVGGRLNIPWRGQILLWGLVILLVGLSAIEWLTHLSQKRREV